MQGTTLNDALVLSANSLSSESYLGRVIIVVTDGNETRSEASLEQTITAAQDAGVSIYVVGIEKAFHPGRSGARERDRRKYYARVQRALAGGYKRSPRSFRAPGVSST